MCGIVGAIYGPNGSGVEEMSPSLAAESMFADVEHRGKDAFGWMHLDYAGKMHVEKHAMPAKEGIDLGIVDSIPDNLFWWVGHVRLATHGHESYPDNNHPIEHGNWFGVHNGICYNYDSVLKQTGRHNPLTEVDSEAIFASLNAYGFDGLDKIDALAAVVAVDKRNPDTVHLITCDANPLYIRKSKSGAHYFASCSWILDNLNVEWDEDMFLLGDYQRITYVGGVESEYIQWADAEKKEKQFATTKTWGTAAVGSNYYSSYSNQTDHWNKVWNDEAHFSDSTTDDAFFDHLQKDGKQAWTYCCTICGDEFEDYWQDCPNCGAPDECIMEVEVNGMGARPKTKSKSMVLATHVAPKETASVVHLVDGQVLTPAEYNERLYNE